MRITLPVGGGNFVHISELGNNTKQRIYERNTINDCLAVLTIGLLGSCSKINERLDNLDKRIDGIKTSISDLGQIRSDISSLKQSASDHSVDIFN